MIDVGKLLTGDNPNTEALMKEIYDFEESLAKVSRTVILNTLYTVLHGLTRSYTVFSFFFGKQCVLSMVLLFAVNHPIQPAFYAKRFLVNFIN